MSETAKSNPSTYRGACHCGAVKFEAQANPQSGTGRCNCSICAKLRHWGTQADYDSFKLLEGEDALSQYTFGSHAIRWKFCRHCGVHCFGEGYIEEMGGNMRSVNVAILEGLDPETLASLPVRYYDGLHDNWWEAPAITSYL